MGLREGFSALDKRARERVLAQTVNELTLAVRGCYPLEGESWTDDRGARVRTFNEIVHQISSHLASSLGESQERYTDQDFFAIILDLAVRGRCEKEVEAAFSRAMRLESGTLGSH